MAAKVVDFLDLRSEPVHLSNEQELTITSLAHHPSGEKLFTCGSDGIALQALINADGQSSQAPSSSSINDHDGAVNAICLNKQGDRLYSCGNDHTVKSYTVGDEVAFESLVTKFECRVRHVDVSNNDEWIATAADNGNVRVVMVSNHKETRTLRAHEGSVRYVSFDPQTNFLASAGTDGCLRIWSVHERFNKIGEIKGIVPKGDAEHKDNVYLSKMSWHPSSTHLAVPSNGDIKMVKSTNWTVETCLSGNHSGAVTMTLFSPNGTYLATADIEGKVNLWSVADRKVVTTYSHSEKITGMCWHPTENCLSMTDLGGMLYHWDNCAPTSPHEISRAVQQAQQRKISTEEDDILNDLEQADREMEEKEQQKRTEENEVEGGEESEWIVDIENKYDAVKQPKEAKMQEAFQLNATNVVKKRSFLSWTKLGLITARDEKTQIHFEIDFHDVGKKAHKFTDHNGLTLGALGNKGAIFASRAYEDAPATLLYYPTDSLGPNGQWSVSMETEEDIQVVAVTDLYVACASDNVLRIFTHSGMQISILDLPGPVVTLSGHSESLLAVVYHSGSPSGGRQDLSFRVYDLSKRKTVSTGHLTLSKKSTLTWIGFTDSNVLATCDSSRVVRFFASGSYESWVRVGTLPPNQWMFGVSDDKAHVVAGKEPSVVPRPRVNTVPLNVPFLNSDKEITRIEGRYPYHKSTHKGPWEDIQVEREKAAVDKHMLTAYEMALKADRPDRALSIAHLFSFEKVMERAISIADKYRHRVLASQLSDLLVKFKSEEEEEEEEEVKVVRPATSTKPAPVVSVVQEEEMEEAEEEAEEEEEEEADENDKSRSNSKQNSPVKEATPSRKRGRFAIDKPITTKTAGAKDFFKTMNKEESKKKTGGTPPAAPKPSRKKQRVLGDLL
ncbi:hypothetical protein PROFUN_07831 [Planoprotostelium fungivorum]|uniref:Uncharacterized protein n=1 Tax=Planoprotostelium fungivorum TaxID=1890364 RepID=A0A2P6NLA8_9EUKA|nr:hypothetical protein PROFUN_07831 [Planoprotostelium fungivorum]